MEQQTLFTIRPSFRPIKMWYIIATIILILYTPIFFYAFNSMDGLATAIPVSILINPAFYILLVAAVKHLNRNHTVYTLTTEKIKIRTGVLGKAENNVPLSKIQNVASAYSLSQRLFGIGNIIIESAGGHIGDIPLRDIEKPDEYVHKILEAMHSKERLSSPQHINT